MTIFYWIIFGLITGSIANFIAPSSGGIISSIILGIIGAVVGGYLGQRYFDIGITGFNATSFIVSVSGSLVVILISRILSRS